VLAVVAGGLVWKRSMPETPIHVHWPTTIRDVVPVPATVEPQDGVVFTIKPDTTISTAPDSEGAMEVGIDLANLLRSATAYPMAVVPATSDAGPAGGIALLLDGADSALGQEGYRLDVTATAVTIRASAPVGLFRGVQTLRQMLPAAVEGRDIRPGALTVPGGRIVDYPRFAYRGMMLDVARHFFNVADVKRLIDLAALYKVNHLHVHLTDDQGWRIAIESWPRLTTVGGGTEVGHGPGGYYTEADYREIVAYAQRHFITVVPEIDLPGHTNAALASYAELSCDGKAPPRYTGTAVGFSSLCVDKEVTYRFLDNVFGELAALTPGPYLHIGGDEAHTLTPEAYSTIVTRAQEIVGRHGKTVIGWHEVAASTLLPTALTQFWGTTPTASEMVVAAKNGNRVIMSPANRAYLDMKYDQRTRLGLSWAGFIEVSDAYDWDPATYLAGVDEDAVFGVESALWTETIRTMDEVEQMTFPRLPAIAELGWSPARTHDWDTFRHRLGAQAPRWTALGVDFYRSPQIPWVAGP
jgi:hexosaminidase